MAITGKLELTPKKVLDQYVKPLRDYADDLESLATQIKDAGFTQVKAMNQPAAKDGLDAFERLVTSIKNNLKKAISDREKEQRRKAKKA